MYKNGLFIRRRYNEYLGNNLRDIEIESNDLGESRFFDSIQVSISNYKGNNIS